jgi:hypothetical protein
MKLNEVVCPGCGLSMPKKESTVCNSYYNVSPECWDLYTEVLAAEYGNAFLFGRIHQLTVDAYAVQHAGAKHPDKSVMIHLIGLHLAFVRGFQSFQIPTILQRIASSAQSWPHFAPVGERIPLTVFDVALCSTTEEHMEIVRKWAGLIWDAWSVYHFEIEDFISDYSQERIHVETSQRNV